MDQGSRTINALVLIGLISLICMLVMVPVLMGTSPAWTASGSSGGNVIITTGTFTTTNALGQVVTTTGLVTYTVGTYTTTNALGQTTTITTTTGAGQAGLQIILSGTNWLLDQDGNVIETGALYQLYEVAGGYIGPISGLNKTVTAFALDAAYSVSGIGVDWSSLQVSCSVNGLSAQPSITDANKAEVVYQPSTALHEWKNMNSKTGTLTHTASLSSLLGGRAWDHGRKLTARLDIACTATAAPASGFMVWPGPNLEATVGPVSALGHMSWRETPTPTDTTPPPGPEPTTTPSPDYSRRVVEKPPPESLVSTAFLPERQRYYHGVDITKGPFLGQLLGIRTSLVEIYGATADTSGSENLLTFAIVLVVGSVAAWFVLKRKPSLG